MSSFNHLLTTSFHFSCPYFQVRRNNQLRKWSAAAVVVVVVAATATTVLRQQQRRRRKLRRRINNNNFQETIEVGHQRRHPPAVCCYSSRTIITTITTIIRLVFRERYASLDFPKPPSPHCQWRFIVEIFSKIHKQFTHSPSSIFCLLSLAKTRISSFECNVIILRTPTHNGTEQSRLK